MLSTLETNKYLIESQCSLEHGLKNNSVNHCTQKCVMSNAWVHLEYNLIGVWGKKWSPCIIFNFFSTEGHHRIFDMLICSSNISKMDLVCDMSPKYLAIESFY